MDNAVLAVSELVTNTVVHTTSAIELSLRRLSDDALWIGVRDDSDRVPRPRASGPDDIAGRGLVIIEAIAHTWGIDTSEGRGGKTVWLELRKDPPHSPS